MASDKNEQEEQEYNRRTNEVATDRYHRYPHNYADPNARLLRLGDYASDPKACAEPVFKGMTFEVISQKHQEFTKAWRELPEYHMWVHAIEETVLKQQKLHITSCMCLGLGTFTGTVQITEPRFREVHLAQLVVFESLIDLLNTKFDIKNIYFQEPRFSTLDEEFLQSRGYEILQTPASDAYMTEETFLFTPGAQETVIDSSLESAFPGMYITHDMTEHFQYHRPPITDQAVVEAEMLPGPELKPRRKLYTEFMNQRAVRALPKFVWKEKKFHHWLYYKPDSEAETGKWEWQVKEEEWVTMKEAERIWRERGVLPPKSVEKH